MEYTAALPCFKCGKNLTNVMREHPNTPYDAVAFQGRGQYGSRIFDPLNGTYLELNICDECLRNAAEKSILLGSPQPTPEPKYDYINLDEQR